MLGVPHLHNEWRQQIPFEAHSTGVKSFEISAKALGRLLSTLRRTARKPCPNSIPILTRSCHCDSMKRSESDTDSFFRRPRVSLLYRMYRNCSKKMQKKLQRKCRRMLVVQSTLLSIFYFFASDLRWAALGWESTVFQRVLPLYFRQSLHWGVSV